MVWASKLLVLSFLGLAACQQRSISGGGARRRQRVPAGKSEIVNFNCPEDFGYYPHPSDCTQYYVCVFGGALQESCTGGLVYSHELQTCDWPRNVVCNLKPAGSGVSTVHITDPRTQSTNTVRAATEPLTPSVGSNVRFQNSPSASQSLRASDSFSVFEGSGKSRQPKILRQEPEPQQSLSRFSQQSFFDPAVQESSSRSVVQPSSPRPPVFPYGKLDSLGQVDLHLQSLEKENKLVQENSLDHLYRSERDVTHLDYPTHDIDIGLPFASAATARFGLEVQPHRLSLHQPLQQQAPGAASVTSRNLKPRIPNPGPSKGIARRQSRPKNAFFNQGFPSKPFQTQQFSRFPPNPFTNPFHSHFPPQTSAANPFGNFQTFNHFTDNLDTRPFTLNHRPDRHPVSQHVFPPRHPSKNTPRPDFNKFNQNPQVSHFPSRPQSQAQAFSPRRPVSKFPPRPENDPFASRPEHPRFPSRGTPVEPFVIEEALPHTSPRPPPRASPTPVSFQSPVRQPSHPPPPPPPQNSVHNFPPHLDSQLDPQFPPQLPVSNHFSVSQFPTHPPLPPPPPPSPLTSTHSPPTLQTQPPLPPQETEFLHTTTKKRLPASGLASTPKTNSLPASSTTAKPHSFANAITERPHRLSPSRRPTVAPKPPKSSTFPPFSNIRPTFPSFDKASLSKSPSGIKSPSPPPQIPGTARHPELSKLSASNSQTLDTESKSPSSTLSQDNHHSSRPQTSFNVAVTPRPVSRPAPTLSPVDEAFYTDFNLTDADYFYYYDDLLYDYYENFPALPTTTEAPVRHPLATSAPVRQSSRPTSSPSQRGGSGSSSPISVDSSVPKRPAPTRPQPPVDSKATKCDPKVCRLPDCYCGGKDVPGGYAPESVPQLVLLTFDDAVNDLNKGLYRDLFEVGRANPNGCPIVSTMYVSHEWTDYTQVQDLYADGHEIASHSVSHSFGEQFSIKKWAKEIAGQREILAAYGGVKMEDVRGMRAPFLAVGGNKMFKMLYDQNFTYDSSMPVYENKPPSWPYTLDYKLFHDCMIPPCPTNSYPGVWEVPMVMWQDLNGGRCSMGDACTTPPDAEGVYKMLIKNFERHYTSNRAPFGLFYHAAWFTTPHHKEGFIAFLDTITAMDDVWIITNHQLLQWMRDPQPLSTIKNFPPFGCNFPDRKKCTSTKVCNVWHKGGVRYMRTCQQCPEKYPWTGNTGVRSPLNDI